MPFNHPTVLVLLGATGDLAQKKLIPALFDLFLQKKLPERFLLLGASFDEHNDESFRTSVEALLRHTHEDVGTTERLRFCEMVQYVQGDFTDDDFYQSIYDVVHGYNESIGQCANVLFYLAVPPQLYSAMFTSLSANESLDICAGTGAWARLMVEKPFGNNLKTAHALEEQLCGSFSDEQVYRIDHYLAKHAIEDVLTIRFANPLFSSLWNEHSITAIDVTLGESHVVDGRGSFYDVVGALRDVGQNHVMQILALLLMEEVDIANTAAVRAARAKVVDSLRFSRTAREPVRGQYESYRSLEGVADDSTTETAFAFGLKSMSPDWSDVDITVKAGKAFSKTLHEIRVTFTAKREGVIGFQYDKEEYTNELVIQLVPEYSINLSLLQKEGIGSMKVAKRWYELTDARQDGHTETNMDAYEKVLHDAIVGDQTRFVSGEEVMAAWRLIETVHDELCSQPLTVYKEGDSIESVFGEN